MKSLVSLARRLASSARPSPRGPKASRPVLRVEALEDRYMLSTFTVINTLNAGAGSLRAAILNANNQPGRDEIIFNIPGGGVKRIQPTTALPSISGPVLLNGASQPGYAGTPLIELNGALAGANVSGLRITADGSYPDDLTVVQGLAINGFASGAGVYINSAAGVQLMGNRIGTNPAGTAALPNRNGVTVACTTAAPCDSILIGSYDSGAARNLISGNSQDGVLVTGSGQANVSIANNWIGTTADGAAALGNGRNGVTATGALRGVWVSDNVISANRSHGVQITRGTGHQAANDVSLYGNIIGYSAGYGSGLGNQLDGVNFFGPSIASSVNYNAIAYSGRDGVRVDGGGRVGIMSNSMEYNSLAGIRLLNGGNNMTPRPTITSAVYDGARITVSGFVNAPFDTPVAVEVYSSRIAHLSGYGEGAILERSLMLQTNANGRANFTASFVPNYGYWNVSVTASPYVSFSDAYGTIEYYGDTSPFSASVRPDGVGPGPSPGGPESGLLAALPIRGESSAVLSVAEQRREQAIASDESARDAARTLPASDDSAPRRSAAVRKADLAFAGLSLEQPMEWLAW